MPDTKALIVQSDLSILLDVHDADAEAARMDIAPFTELEKSPEHIHSYRVTPLSLWNAASAGLDFAVLRDSLLRHSRFPVADSVFASIRETLARFGKLVLEAVEGREDVLFLRAKDEAVRREIAANRRLTGRLTPAGDDGFLVSLVDRGTIKQELIKIGWPVKDEAPLREGDSIVFTLRDVALTGHPFVIRDYQEQAARSLVGDRRPGSGFGTIVLPCGAGKTVVGIRVMDLLKTSTLILTTNVAAVHQWIDELCDKTGVDPKLIGEYTGDRKDIQPITVATYQILVWRPNPEADFPHFAIFRSRAWGLIIYDEVHLLPAPVFRVTAEIQALRRCGLTATLVREDGREGDVFCLVGPKRYDVPWKELEARGWIAEANCYEIRIDLPDALKIPYAVAEKREKFRLASENPRKLAAARQLIANHPEDAILVIGQYLNQLALLSQALDAPIITGQTPNKKREELYEDFKSGKIRVLVVSKVANFAIDLPDASVAIQVSGTFGSRQEEAQRLGRILRPKKKNSYFYSVVSRLTTEEEFASHRQKFLTEQGYKYHIEVWNEAELDAPIAGEAAELAAEGVHE